MPEMVCAKSAKNETGTFSFARRTATGASLRSQKNMPNRFMPNDVLANLFFNDFNNLRFAKYATLKGGEKLAHFGVPVFSPPIPLGSCRCLAPPTVTL